MTDSRVVPELWFICREYADIAEAGGIKNVIASLAENFAARGTQVRAFIPFFACTDLSAVSDYRKDTYSDLSVKIDDKPYTVQFSTGMYNGVSIIFVEHQIFAEKNAIYTYTESDEKKNSAHRRGEGFCDSLLVDVLFQKAVVAFFEKNNITPRLVHCHDAPTALVPALAKAAFSGRFSQTKFITTIHNAGQGYHHEFGSVDEAARFTGIDRNMLAKALNSGRVEPYLLAAQYGELTTVSPWYAEELLANRVPDYSGGLTDCFRAQKIHITGITNGITVEKYDPRYTEKSKLPFAFDPASGDIAGKYECRAFLAERTNACAEKHVESMQQFGTLAPRHDDEKRCLFVYHGRIARQKGINVLICAIDILLSRGEAKAFIVCGQGEAQLENELVALAKKYPGKCVYFRGYDKRLVRLVTAAADFIVLPSDFEPCCLEDFIAQLFGTIPVAHSTGGLQKILHGKTGFLYDDNSPAALAAVLSKLGADFCENRQKYEKIMRFAAAYVKSAYSWNTIIEKYYLPLYQSP